MLTVPAALSATGLDPALLILELTEAAMLKDEGRAISVLEHLKNLGVGDSLDGLGTGYSSLSYLIRLPLDWVKIDRSFVHELRSHHESHTMVRSIIALAHSVGLRIVAEGVDTDAQQDLRRRSGCDYAKGFLYSSALPAEELARWLESVSSESGGEPKPSIAT